MSERTIRTSGAELRVSLDGPDAGPVLVLVNSLGTTLEMWDPQVLRLSAFTRVVRYDLRGHGGSSAPPGPYTIADLGSDLVDLLDELGAEQSSLCGLSIGGSVAMWVAAHHPHRVRSLVVACSTPVCHSPDAFHERAALVRRDGPSTLTPYLLERWLPPEFAARRPDLTVALAGMLASCSAEGYAACCEAIAALDLRSTLGSITAPALVIGGAQDAGFAPSSQAELAGALAARLVVLAHSSHLANLTEPEAFSEAAVAHLTGEPVLRGMAARREVLGDAHVARSAASPDDATRMFVDLLHRYAWGEAWSRPGLDRRSRSIATLATLIALGRSEELELHVRGARRNGLSAEEIGEVVLHSAIYAGVPAANSAMAVVRRVLAEETGDSDGSPP